MEKRIAPSEQKAQALQALLAGQAEGQSGAEVVSTLVRLATERVLQLTAANQELESLNRSLQSTVDRLHEKNRRFSIGQARLETDLAVTAAPRGVGQLPLAVRGRVVRFRQGVDGLELRDQ